VPDSFVEFPLERAHHLARWQELVDDPALARWPGRVETDRVGADDRVPDSGVIPQFSSG
jgi:hypothetical protein